MMRGRQSETNVGVTEADSLVGLTQGSHYRSNASDAADIKTLMPSSCSADRCSDAGILISQQIDPCDCFSSSHADLNAISTPSTRPDPIMTHLFAPDYLHCQYETR